MNCVNVLGFPIAVTNYEGAVRWALEMAEEGDRAYAVEAANTHVIALARQEKDFGNALSQFELIVPDGMPLVWAVNSSLPRMDRLKSRVYGPTLMLRLMEATGGRANFKHFLLGGKESTLEALSDHFREKFPDSVIAGTYSPPFGEWPEDEFERICNKIREVDANIIWVGLGCPKQERWIADGMKQLPFGVYFGIGAAFAFHAGEVKQAPGVLQKLGLEWAYRLIMEPRRLFRRYLVYNSLFIYRLFTEKLFSRVKAS